MKKVYITTCLLAACALLSFTFIPKPNFNVIFIGDSITYGAGITNRDKDAPPALAAAYLRHRYPKIKIKFLNLGVSGYTTLDFLPLKGAMFGKVKAAADTLYADPSANLIFSVMLGTNDSAIKGPHGAPVTDTMYKHNLKVIIDSLLANYPDCKVIVHCPIWYSPNTNNRSVYLQEGLTRLQTYFPEIDSLVSDYGQVNKGHVYAGDKKAFNYFKKNYLTDLRAENGQKGVFYLHPNEKGAAVLGGFWGKAIGKILK